jgi:flagellar biosynthetic protein FlhB
MADDEDQSSKTQDPTERKLRQLRDDGNVPTSREVNNLFALLGIVLVVGLGLQWSFWRLGGFAARMIQDAGVTPMDDPHAVANIMSYMGMSLLVALLPILVLLMIMGVFAGYVQTGGTFSGKPIQPDLGKLSPLAGFKRMFGLKSLVELLKSIIKMSVIGAAMAMVMWNKRNEIMALVDMDVVTLLDVLKDLTLWVVGAAVAIMFILAVADYLFQRMQYIIQNRMSHKELKDEVRETEGDPHIKARQRQLRRERSRKRMMAEVPKADVVVTNPTHFACALRYKPDEGDAAPVLVAKGADAVALRIREIATEHNIPLYEDPPLARQLYRDVGLDEPIPIVLYDVVAKVMAFVMALKKKG